MPRANRARLYRLLGTGTHRSEWTVDGGGAGAGSRACFPCLALLHPGAADGLECTPNPPRAGNTGGLAGLSPHWTPGEEGGHLSGSPFLRTRDSTFSRHGRSMIHSHWVPEVGQPCAKTLGLGEHTTGLSPLENLGARPCRDSVAIISLKSSTWAEEQ